MVISPNFQLFLDIIPIVIACIAVALTVLGMKKKATKDRLDAMDRRIDRAYQDLAKCEETTKILKTENKSLRQDKVDLLQKVAELAKGDNQ